jgi:hypothetical protein
MCLAVCLDIVEFILVVSKSSFWKYLEPDTSEEIKYDNSHVLHNRAIFPDIARTVMETNTN